MADLIKVRGCDNPERRGDVIFVHGLNGNPREYWWPPGEPEKFWPAWVGEDLPDVGVWSLGYENAALKPRRFSFSRKLLQGGFAMPLEDRADNILLRLESDHFGERPLVFITHSMGGLLIKEVLRTANDSSNPRRKDIVEQTRGVCFIATPHIGSDLAKWASYFKTLLGTNVAMDELRPHEPHLRKLNQWYRDFVAAEQRRIKTLSFYEMKPTAIIGRLVVEPGDADPGVPNAGLHPLDEDHASICKPGSKNHQIHVTVTDFIRRECLQLDEGPSLPDPLSPSKNPDIPKAQARSVMSEMRNDMTGNAKQSAPQDLRRTSVFVSYSHKDQRWLERLQIHLKPMVREGTIDLWDDTRIKAGDKWKEEIQKAIATSKVAVLLISADFLASDFIHDNELPPLLAAAEHDGAKIIPVIVSPSRFDETPTLSQFQAVNPSSKPLNGMTKKDQEKFWVKLANEIEAILKRDGARSVANCPSDDHDKLHWEAYRLSIRSHLEKHLAEIRGTSALMRLSRELGISSPSSEEDSLRQRIADYLMGVQDKHAIPKIVRLHGELCGEGSDRDAGKIADCVDLILPLYFSRSALSKAWSQLQVQTVVLIQGTVATEMGAEVIMSHYDGRGASFLPHHQTIPRGEGSVPLESPPIGDPETESEVLAILEDLSRGSHVVPIDKAKPEKQGKDVAARTEQLCKDLRGWLEPLKHLKGRTPYCALAMPKTPAEREYLMKSLEKVRELVPYLIFIELFPESETREQELYFIQCLNTRLISQQKLKPT
jgi:pimeloyl-ACP methyl ester carboxylesterase